MAGLVAIVGRPNVGKSTLFNRLVGHRAAIVDEQAGVTRDRIYGQSDWNGVTFSLVDTGGIVAGSDDVFEVGIRRQAELAIQECDVVLFVVDVLTGITDLDDEVAALLRRADKPVMLLVNKVDDATRQAEVYAFYNLGLGDPMAVSAINGSGTGEILDKLVTLLPPEPLPEQNHLPRLTIVGRPNAGKSSIVNALLGEDRNIVTPIPGTTRDAISTHYNKFGFDFIMVDTAGLRKKTRVDNDLEYYSVLRAMKAMEQADVCLLVVDAQRGFEGQDQTIFSRIISNRKGVVILMNKWDLVEKDQQTAKATEEEVRRLIAPFTDVPIFFTSALTKQRLLKVLETALEVQANRARRIPTRKLNDVMLPIIQATPPPTYKGKYIRIKYVTQLPTLSPSFAFFCNLPQYVRDPYKRFLENQLRAAFPLQGVPIQIYMRKK